MREIELTYYVLNYDFNGRNVIFYNVFNNFKVYEESIKELKKYCRSSKKYTYRGMTGFPALSKAINDILKWQEWSRCEYEISVGAPFENDPERLEKFDCWEQCRPNIDAITRDILYQYKRQIKEVKE